MSDKVLLGNIGKKVREWRLEANISQAALAENAQVSLSTVAALESGKNISMNGLVRILRMLGKLDALLPFLEEKQISPIEYERLQERKKTRKRASKNNSHDQLSQGIPLWKTDGDASAWK